MTKLRKIVISFLLLIVAGSLLFLAGCPAPERRPAPPPPNAVPGPAPGTDVRNVDPNSPGRQMTPAQDPANPSPGSPTNPSREANRLANMLETMPEVNSAYVVLTGRTALVGLDVKANLTDARMNAVKAEVTRRIKRANERVTTVTVTADADTVTRLRRIADGIGQGRPLSSFADEMAEITRRLAPTTR